MPLRPSVSSEHCTGLPGDRKLFLQHKKTRKIRGQVHEDKAETRLPDWQQRQRQGNHLMLAFQEISLPLTPGGTRLSRRR
jgi:hypothetical protein